MRNDMYKVLHESVRAGGRQIASRHGLKLVDGECLEPTRESLRKRHIRGHNGKEHTFTAKPLWRFLNSRVGKSWDSVYSEIRNTLTQRDSVLRDVMRFFDVSVNTMMSDGEVWVRDEFRGAVPVLESYYDFYVHPTSRLLCRVPSRRTSSRRYYEASRQKALDKLREYRREVDSVTQLHKVDGQWYEVKLAELPEVPVCNTWRPSSDPGWTIADFYAEKALWRFDALLGRDVNRASFKRMLTDVYGVVMYAQSKTQLSTRALRFYGLNSDAKAA